MMTLYIMKVGFGRLLEVIHYQRNLMLGLMMAMGSLLVLLSIILLVPGLVLVASRDQPPRYPWGRDQLITKLEQLVNWVQRRRAWILAGAVMIAILSVCGIPRLKLETDFTRNFRQDSELVQAYHFIEDRLGGSGSWDLLVPAPRQLNEDYVQRVERLPVASWDVPLNAIVSDRRVIRPA